MPLSDLYFRVKISDASAEARVRQRGGVHREAPEFRRHDELCTLVVSRLRQRGAEVIEVDGEEAPARNAARLAERVMGQIRAPSAQRPGEAIAT